MPDGKTDQESTPECRLASPCQRYEPDSVAEMGLNDQAASAFMIDLSQVSLALRGATPRSLVILDEFGKGIWRWLLTRAVLTPKAPSPRTGQGC